MKWRAVRAGARAADELNGQRRISIFALSGNVLITGYFGGTIDFGGGLMTSAGSNDIFVAKFTASGSHEWSKRFGETDDYAEGNSVAVDNGDKLLSDRVFRGHEHKFRRRVAD